MPPSAGRSTRTGTPPARRRPRPLAGWRWTAGLMPPSAGGSTRTRAPPARRRPQARPPRQPRGTARGCRRMADARRWPQRRTGRARTRDPSIGGLAAEHGGHPGAQRGPRDVLVMKLGCPPPHAALKDEQVVPAPIGGRPHRRRQAAVTRHTVPPRTAQARQRTPSDRCAPQRTAQDLAIGGAPLPCATHSSVPLTAHAAHGPPSRRSAVQRTRSSRSTPIGTVIPVRIATAEDGPLLAGDIASFMGHTDTPPSMA
jgi:hypothetical protein